MGRSWSLTSEAFERLLQAMGAERAKAAEEYESLRRKLVHHFQWHQQRDPEALADEVLNRLARKLAESAGLADYRQYSLGIARLLLLEVRRREMHERQAFAATAPTSDASLERKFQCLERCLDELQAENKELILNYYQGDKQERISARSALSEKLGIELNALRNRALRIRLKLEACLSGCLDCDKPVNPDSKDREAF